MNIISYIHIYVYTYTHRHIYKYTHIHIHIIYIYTFYSKVLWRKFVSPWFVKKFLAITNLACFWNRWFGAVQLSYRQRLWASCRTKQSWPQHGVHRKAGANSMCSVAELLRNTQTCSFPNCWCWRYAIFMCRCPCMLMQLKVWFGMRFCRGGHWLPWALAIITAASSFGAASFFQGSLHERLNFPFFPAMVSKARRSNANPN